MNTLDIVILVLFIPGIIRGITKGFMEQAISLAGIVLSVYVAYHFSSYACDFIQKYITVSETVLHIGAHCGYPPGQTHHQGGRNGHPGLAQ